MARRLRGILGKVGGATRRAMLPFPRAPLLTLNQRWSDGFGVRDLSPESAKASRLSTSSSAHYLATPGIRALSSRGAPPRRQAGHGYSPSERGVRNVSARPIQTCETQALQPTCELEETSGSFRRCEALRLR
ncbi:hypothetical protein CC1G_07906 [Coprinopsis cinerea okayama7|uniref:Uncharacterized protein n=1 Tax=Coprinopsis cinerea (strain Okayama-7 / 130 / ATCC MYA-4618 / FGSC 9003) TaxID=240176 RepID=A8P6N3_COPC7|nr:hypothetical protein CC1G_07906 [Coprinopsis cinerea okayama7\|eukprot:XP_001839191.2 hypothetical protein CC1G_07906 [Coprinopsis cinerea okayama7\